MIIDETTQLLNDAFATAPAPLVFTQSGGRWTANGDLFPAVYSISGMWFARAAESGPLCASDAPDRAVRDALHAHGVASRLPDAKLAAAYREVRAENETLRAQLRELREERDAARADVASLDVLARGERAMVDTAQDVIADLRAEICECAAMGLELGRRLTERETQLADKTTEARDAEDKVSDLTAENERLRDVKGAAIGLVHALRTTDPVQWDAAERAVCMAVNATGTDDIAASVREHNTPERIAELLVQNERLQSRLDRALRACHIVTYGDGGITECADVVGEMENSKRLDELKEESR